MLIIFVITKYFYVLERKRKTSYTEEKNYQNRQIAFIENGSWAPMAAKVMNNMLSDCKNITFAETLVTIQSAMKASTEEKVCQLAKELCKDYQ